MPDDVTDRPWKAAAPLPDNRKAQPANRRYARACRLDDMMRKLRTLGDRPEYAKRAAHWRYCLEYWQDYLDGAIDPPHGGNKPIRDTDVQ